MASFIHLLAGVTLALVFISLVGVHSSPTNTSPTLVVPVVATFTETKHVKCHSDTDCNGHGHCTNESICACERGWSSHGNASDTSKYCTYKQRSKQTAFFLSLFAGIFGADWFYLSRANFGYIIAGIVKLLLACGCCGAWPLTYFGPEIQNYESIKAKLRGVSTLFSLLAFAWWIVDWARILGNRFLDGNGASLMPW